MVHFVGAGPGATDLITLRGQKYIENADVIIYAGSLVNPALLDSAKPDCEIENSAYLTLEQVIAIIKQADEKGKDIVRLHTGDPSIYGAIREQMDELDELGIEYDVCPGVSSFCGAAAALGLEYTLPEISQSVIITREEGRTALPKGQSLKEMAAHGSTMVLFLSAGLAQRVREDLLEGGYEKDTPVAVVYKATWPEERVVKCTIDTLPEALERENIKKTALIIVGGVVAADRGSYERSKLYDAGFETEYRKNIK